MIARAAVENVLVPLIDGRNTEWQSAAEHLLGLQKNFIIILRNRPSQGIELTKLIGYKLEHFERWHAFAMARFLSPEDGAHLKTAVGSGDWAFFVELINVPALRPPKAKPFLSYSDIAGVLAEANSLEEAKVSCERYAQAVVAYPECRIYHWNNDQWEELRTLCV